MRPVEGPPTDLIFRRVIHPWAMLRELWQRRELVVVLTERDVRARYKQTRVGFAWALITPFVFWLVSRYGIERTNRVARITLFLGVGLVLAIVVDQIVGFFRFEVLFIPRRPPPIDVTPFLRVRRLWFVNEYIVYCAVLAAAFARDYFLRYRARREEAARLQADTAHLQAQLADARLAALRAQVNPHFLFNTLHAISALVERDPKGVRRMIARLSELLRTTLEGADEAEVTLAQEVVFLRRYLEIMQIRFQGRLEVDIRIDRTVRESPAFKGLQERIGLDLRRQHAEVGAI